MSAESLKDITGKGIGVMIYFFSPTCNACEALRPRVREMVAESFPELSYVEIDSSEKPSITAEAAVYSAPTILVFFEGKETIRESKYVSVAQLNEKIERYYNMIF